ncbi:MAG: histidine kinase [Flavobacteriales bacterium]|nr:histidine kinase [Flavobacteriales bacterium]
MTNESELIRDIRIHKIGSEELNPLILAERYRGLSLSLLQIRRKTDVSEELVKIRQKNLLLLMNPHFIFNVLSGIHMLLIKGDTQKTLEALGKFKRLLIRCWGSATDNPTSLRISSVQKEVDFINDYFDLESLRLSGEVTFKISTNVDLDHEIPAFLIQPIVENALWHGVEMSGSEGLIPKIELSFDVDSDRNLLEISVLDNGHGLTKASNLKAPIKISEAKRQSHGINILRERLRLISEEAEFRLENRIDQRGCVATISLPYRN